MLISGTTGAWRNTFRIFESAPFYSELFRVCVFYFTPSHSDTHTRTLTPPLHKSACHGGDIACMQSWFIKRMALFYFFPPLFPSVPVTSPLCHGSFCIWHAFVRHPAYLRCCPHHSLPPTMTKKGVFRQLQAMTAKFITGDKWGYYPCCQAGRSDATRQLQVLDFWPIFMGCCGHKKNPVYFKMLPSPVYYFVPWCLTGYVTCGTLHKLKIEGIMEAFSSLARVSSKSHVSFC